MLLHLCQSFPLHGSLYGLEGFLGRRDRLGYFNNVDSVFVVWTLAQSESREPWFRLAVEWTLDEKHHKWLAIIAGAHFTASYRTFEEVSVLPHGKTRRRPFVGLGDSIGSFDDCHRNPFISLSHN